MFCCAWHFLSASGHFLCSPLTQTGGTSQALCTPMMKTPTVSGFERFLCTPITKRAGAPQALCTPMVKSPRVSGLERSAHEACGASQALCSPRMKTPTVSGCAPPRTKTGGRLRRCAPPMRETRRALTSKRTNLSPFPKGCHEKESERKRKRM